MKILGKILTGIIALHLTGCFALAPATCQSVIKSEKGLISPESTTQTCNCSCPVTNSLFSLAAAVGAAVGAASQ